MNFQRINQAKSDTGFWFYSEPVSDSVQCPVPSFLSVAPRVQRPESSVQSTASRVKRPEYSVQSPESNTCVQSSGIPVRQ